jgi:hypothetical protein
LKYTKKHLDENTNIISIEVNEIMTERIREVNAAKYDILRTMLDVVLDVTEEIDETLGAEMGLENLHYHLK